MGDLEDQLGRLRWQVADLERENRRLHRLLGWTRQEATPPAGAQTAIPAQDPGLVTNHSPAEAKVAAYAGLFRARADVYALAWSNTRAGRSGWVPAVKGGRLRGIPANEREYLPLTAEVIEAHLTGDRHIGLYPLLQGDRTCWLAADFDGPAAMLDALAYLKAARAVGAPACLEVSRSGVGAHVWIFFTAPAPAAAARAMGARLVREAIAVRGRMSLGSYDRLFPSQDARPTGGFGNLIAAPLQGECRRRGATVFVDLATMEPYHDQWAYLSTLDKMTPAQVTKAAAPAAGAYPAGAPARLRPAASTVTRPPAAPVVHVRLGAGVAVPAAELSPALYASLTHAASVANPEFYARQRARRPTWGTPRIIQCFEETVDGDLILPRGLTGAATDMIGQAGSRVDLREERSPGTRLQVSFGADLSPPQQAAVRDALEGDLGLIVAPPGAGKTVMGCAVIARRGVSTLILVDRKTLADQWRTRVDQLLGVTPGQLGGGRTRLTGAIDVATLQTLTRREDIGDLLAGYGQVLVDECHHLPAAAFAAAAGQIRARYWLGLTATPYRRDRLDALIGFQLGPARHTMTPPAPGTLDAGSSGVPTPLVTVHRTRFRADPDTDASQPGAITDIYRQLAADQARNTQIITDVTAAAAAGRNALVLTRLTGHATHLAGLLTAAGLDPVLLTGRLGVRARKAAIDRLHADHGPGLLVVATGSYVGEGFDLPALDALFLAAPIAFKGRLVQYAGRILRAHPGKTTAHGHDYHDILEPVLAAMLAKRAPGYTSLGFPDPRTSTP